MTQQVNLYQPILRRQEKVFSAKTIGQIVLVAVVVMVISWGFNLWQVKRYEAELANLQRSEKATTEQFTALTAKLQGETESRDLRTVVDSLRVESQLKQKLLQSIDQQGVGEANGFAERFAALGRQRINGLWLTDIVFLDNGANIILGGQAYRADLVPQLIQKLSAEPSFSGTRFREIEVRLPDDNKHKAVEFHVSTQESKPDEDPIKLARDYIDQQKLLRDVTEKLQ